MDILDKLADSRVATDLVRGYGRAVSARQFWKDHGRRGDGNLAEAEKKEAQARRELLAYVRKLERENRALKECHAVSA